MPRDAFAGAGAGQAVEDVAHRGVGVVAPGRQRGLQGLDAAVGHAGLAAVVGAPFDVGAGAGQFANMLAASGKFGSVAALDHIRFEKYSEFSPLITRYDASIAELPFDDDEFDAATIAFGMRNLADYRQGFAEMARAVRPGGKVVCFEIHTPTSLFGRLAAVWFDHVVPLIGKLVGQGDAYGYLANSVKDYPSPERIAEIMREAGLERVDRDALRGHEPELLRVEVGAHGHRGLHAPGGDRAGRPAAL